MLSYTKYIFCLAVGLILSSNSLAYDKLQSIDAVIEKLKLSMSSGDAQNFSEYFDHTIDMTYSGTSSNYTRSHAKIIFNDFYEKNHPKSFKVEYKGVSPYSDAQYVIGTANTDNGVFKIYLYIKNKGGKQVIQEIKIGKR